jgi:hypothetical protein
MDSNYSNYFTVTPSDATTFARCTQAIYVGGAGNVSVVPSGNTLATVTFTAVPAGTTLCRASREDQVNRHNCH